MKLKIPPPLQALFFAILMWLIDSFSLVGRITFPAQSALAVVFLSVGIFIIVIAIRSFNRADTTINPLKPDEVSNLVIRGVFNYSRNPMYLGLLLILISLFVYLGNLMCIVSLFLFVLYITEFQIKPEEYVLIEKFGDTYQDYMEKVRRWL